MQMTPTWLVPKRGSALSGRPFPFLSLLFASSPSLSLGVLCCSSAIRSEAIASIALRALHVFCKDSANPRIESMFRGLAYLLKCLCNLFCALNAFWMLFSECSKKRIFMECLKTHKAERHTRAGRDARPLGCWVGSRFAHFPPSCFVRAKELSQRRAFGSLVSRGEPFCRPWPPPGPPVGRVFPLSVAFCCTASCLA